MVFLAILIAFVVGLEYGAWIVSHDSWRTSEQKARARKISLGLIRN